MKLLQICNRQVTVRHDVEPDIADVRVRTGEDGKIVDGEHRHVAESHELCVLDLHRECKNAESVVTEPEHGVFEHETHECRLHRRSAVSVVEMMTGTVIWMVREGKRGHPLDIARERRQRRNEALKAMNHDHAVVEQIRLRDLHASDEDLRSDGGAGVVIDRFGGNGDASSRTQGLDLGAKRKFPQIIDGEETWNDVLAEEIRHGARKASPERGIRRSEDSGRTIPGRGSCSYSCSSVRERRRRHRKVVETEM